MRIKLDRKCIYAVVVAVMFSLTSMAYAQDDNTKTKGQWKRFDELQQGRPESFHKEKAEKFAQELGLTPEQQEALKRKRQAHRAQKKEVQEALKVKREELRTELEKANADEGKLNSIATEIKSLQGQLVDLRIEGVMATKEILTEEQLEKINKMKENREKNRRRVGHRKGMRRQKVDSQAEE